MLRIRWLGRVDYADAHALQTGLFHRSADDHLLLLEHPPVYTQGVRARPEHLLVEPADVGAELYRADRGGDVTYHGPGQLVGYPVLSIAGRRGGGMADTAAYVASVEQLVIDVLGDLGLAGSGRRPGHPGVWLGLDAAVPRKIAAVGVRLTRGRSMHGFALNVDPDLTMFEHVVPCGIRDGSVTSLAAEGVAVSMREVVTAVVDRVASTWAGPGLVESAAVAWRHDPTDLSPFSRGEGPGELVGRQGVGHGSTRAGSLRLRGRLAEAGVAEGYPVDHRKPDWLRVPLRMGDDFLRLRREIRSGGLSTVCEEAGCPNISECWNAGTATFMINGRRCTRACGFCLVDTSRPEAPDPDEPGRVAETVERVGLRYAVLTAVARDDLDDGGAGQFADCVEAIRLRTPEVQVEVLIPDCRGRTDALEIIFASRPDVVNHNLETVARLQRAVRPSAAYARSLGVLARAKDAGLVTKSGLIIGMGETGEEIHQALADLRGVGVDIVTIGQYLRPTSHHLPVTRWWTPEEFEAIRTRAETLGFGHVEAGPLTRSSYHARESAAASGAGPEPSAVRL